MFPFAQKFLELSNIRSPFCLGVDPTEEILKLWNLSFNITGLRSFSNLIMEAADGKLSMVKLQAAYFERFGPEGMEVLQELRKNFQKQGTLVIFDGKRGDIGSTSLSYAKTYLSQESFYQFDAITAIAYMGFEALKPMLEYAVTSNTYVFIVVRSSNAEGAILQTARISLNQTVADHLAAQIMNFNEIHSKFHIGPIGAVMGATLKDVSATTNLLNNSLILAPGIDQQGATIDDLLKNYSNCKGRIIPTSSRMVLSKGPHINSLKEEINRNIQESFRLL